MTPKPESADPIAYPCLKRSDIARMTQILSRGFMGVLDSDPNGPDARLLGYLLSFHTKRWGLPEWMRGPSGHES